MEILPVLSDYLSNRSLRALACTSKEINAQLNLYAKQLLSINPLLLWMKTRIKANLLLFYNNQSFAYPISGPVLVGRSASCDIVVPVRSVSMRHIYIAFEDGLLTCIIVGRYRTLLNDRAEKGFHVLHWGDVFRFAGNTLTCRLVVSGPGV